MRALLLAFTVAASAAPSPADWRQAHLPVAVQEALRGAGYGLLEDGRVLDAKSRQALTAEELASALARINLSTQRISLERLKLLLSREPLSDADRAEALALGQNLPDDVTRALAANASFQDLKALTDRDLASIAAYFDGSRTAADRQEAASPVLAGAPGPRVPLPYFSAAERALGDQLRAATASRIGKDRYGRELLGRLNGADGKLDLPPFVVEDLANDALQYDYRRRAVVVDQQALVGSITEGIPAKGRGALEKELASRPALIRYLNAHPEAVAAFAAQNDVLTAHELAHAWQDRRDPLMQEMSRGTLPAAVVIDYEEEAWLVKNLYLRSKLKNDPDSVADDVELSDYRAMTADSKGWLGELRVNYAAAASNALDLKTVGQIQALRLEAERARTVADSDEQAAKSLDLAAFTRAEKELAASAAAERARVEALLGAVAAGEEADLALLGRYYLKAAQQAPNDVEFSVRIQNAESYAAKSGDAWLKSRVAAAKKSRR